MNEWSVICGDALTTLRGLDAGSVQTCVTSPPYFGLRDYGTEGQLGLEPTPDEYVAALVEVFREVRRVLRDDGTLWLNLGDSYARQGGAGAGGSFDAERPDWHPRTWRDESSPPAGTKEKDLLGIPWMVAFALRADGWYLRSDIIWSKPNPMPESVTDRPTKAHEYLFLLSKGPRYYFDADAVREADSGQDHPRAVLDGQASLEPSGGVASPHQGIRTVEGRNGAGRNIRSVWTVATQPFPGAHFAVFPPKLIEPCVLAGSRLCGHECETCGGQGHMGMYENRVPATGPDTACPDCTGSNVVLDPFAGAGTTGLVATRLGRSFIGIELNPEYAEMARQRIRDDQPLMNYLIEAA